jgi:hypothetical protein
MYSLVRAQQRSVPQEAGIPTQKTMNASIGSRFNVETIVVGENLTRILFQQ